MEILCFAKEPAQRKASSLDDFGSRAASCCSPLIAIWCPYLVDLVVEGLETFFGVLMGSELGRDIGPDRLCFDESAYLKVADLDKSDPSGSNETGSIESLERLADFGTSM